MSYISDLAPAATVIELSVTVPNVPKSENPNLRLRAPSAFSIWKNFVTYGKENFTVVPEGASPEVDDVTKGIPLVIYDGTWLGPAFCQLFAI